MNLVILAILVFLVPLVASNNTNELYEFPKMFLVYLAGTLLVGLFFSGWVLKPFKIKKPAWPVLVFVLMNVISTIFSVHFYTSVWGYYTRFNGGLLSTLLYLGIYLVAINKLSKSEILTLIKVACISVVPVGISGILQHFGIGGPMIDRVYSTFGQANWLGQFLAMLLPYLLYLSITEPFYYWSPVFLLGFSCLWFTYSLSGILGLAVALLVFIMVMGKKKMWNKKTVLITGVLFTICLAVSATNLGFFKSRINDVLVDIKSKISSLEKVYALEDPHQISDPGFIRFGLWQGGWNLAVSRPKIFFIGTGPETFPYAFQPFRLESLNYSSEWDFVFNKPHNYYLQLLTEIGILGLISYLGLLYVAGKKLPFYLISGFISFLVTNIFGWPVVATSLLFWLWLAYGEAGE